MATEGIFEASDGTFPAADVNAELNPGDNKDFKVDSVSAGIASSDNTKGQAGANHSAPKEREKKDPMQTLKTAILISAAVVAVAGAAFAITKKLKEK